MKVLQINSTVNTGSTGRIAEGIGLKVIENGGESYIAYGRSANISKSNPIKIGNQWDKAIHLVNTRLFDTHGFHSGNATKELIKKIEVIQPDIIHLHNLHGYYLNIEILFKFLKEWNKPVVWTLHDCWSFTGHCCYYERVKCTKWKTECSKCPLLKLYPQSYLFDNSKSNFHKKKNLFSLPANLHLVTVSNWLEEQVKESFHKHRIVQTIYNGINLEIFKPIDITGLKEKHGFGAKQIILGVANVWSDGKGLNSFIELSKLLKPEQLIILIGLKKDQVKSLPENIIGIERTNSMTELAEFYNMADVFVNPSIAETFGMVTAEAMACGTPSVVYNSSAMPELITDAVGFIVNPNDYQSLFERINIILAHGKSDYSKSCVERAHLLFEMNKQFEEYISLYNRLLNN
jgi:glycosyltransferase involved in cell wall biosynthesis